MGTEGVSAPTEVREVRVSSAVYSLDCVKKSAYRFIDRATVELSVTGDAIACIFSFRAGTSAATADAMVSDFKTELLDQDLRQRVANETAATRNTILALAFAPTKPEERE